jgi:hypothetical protein
MPKQGLLSVNSKVNIKYDTTKWKQAKTNETAKFMFIHTSGDGFVRIMSERFIAAV